MPIYEYECAACAYQLESLQKISDAPLIDCPQCGKPSLRKLISAAGFRLKGGGWYETDFKSGGKKKNVVDAPATPSSPDKAPEKKASSACGTGCGHKH